MGYSYGSVHKVEQGFTLIELMIVVMIIAILAAIALPSYQFVAIRNAEAQAQAAIGQVQVDLERWRATALTYRGFVPMSGVDANGRPTYSYGSNGANGTLIYVPTGSTAANHRYQITLTDAANGNSLNPATASLAAGRAWVMVATPNPNSNISTASTFVVRSTGFKCKTVRGAASSTVSRTTTTCNAAGQEVW